MGMAAILVMLPGPFEQTFVPPSQRGFIWNLIGPVVLEENLFKECGWRTDDGGLPIYIYKLTNEPSAEVS